MSCPLDCIDQGGVFLQRKVHLGCNSLYVQQRAGHPERRGDSPRQVMLGLSEHSEMQSYGLGVPPEPGTLQAMGAPAT